jgi:PIN domain nuclease of toxin-antitoxin system
MSSTPRNLEPFYVVDTHALAWYILKDSKLSHAAISIFQAAETYQTILTIPTIVIAELYYANLKKKWFMDFVSVYDDIISRPYYAFYPLTHTHVRDFVQDVSVPEMHDRIIVGVARRLGAPLISADTSITASGLVRVIW